MAFGDIPTTEAESTNQCCVIVTEVEGDLKIYPLHNIYDIGGEKRYKIAGFSVITGSKMCIPESGETIRPQFTPWPNAFKGITLDCMGGEYPESEKGKVKPLVHFGGGPQVAVAQCDMSWYHVNWEQCAQPCEADVSEIEDCPNYQPPETAPGWEYTGDPRPNCCCFKREVKDVDFEITFRRDLADLTGVIGQGGGTFGVIGHVGRIITDSCGTDFMQEVVKNPAMKGMMGKLVNCLCKWEGKDRDMEMPDMQGSEDPGLGDVLEDVVPGLGIAERYRNPLGDYTPPGLRSRGYNEGSDGQNVQPCWCSMRAGLGF